MFFVLLFDAKVNNHHHLSRKKKTKEKKRGEEEFSTCTFAFSYKMDANGKKSATTNAKDKKQEIEELFKPLSLL